MLKLTRRATIAGAVALSLMSTSAFAADKILGSVPGLSFPFFVHMMNADEGRGRGAGRATLIECDGQNSAPKQTADVEAAIVQGVNGIVISPNDVNAMAPALAAGDRRRHPGRHDRPPRGRRCEGILAHVGADNVKGGEAQGEADHDDLPGRRDDHQPAGPARRRPGHRPQQGPAQRPRPASRTSTRSSSSRPPTSPAPRACR